METNKTDRLHQAILEKLKEETQNIVEEEAKEAAKRVEQRVRGLAGSIATKVASWVTYRPGFDNPRQEIVITVKLPEHCE
jgi:superfamily I DNA and RNA helicase